MKQLAMIWVISYFLSSGFSSDGVQQTASVSPGPYVNPYTKVREGQSLIKEGDLVVRLNRAATSCFIRLFNKQDKSYSHSGIVIYNSGYPYAYHIIDGQENPDGRMRRDALSEFCSPRRNKSHGIFRYDMNNEEIKKLRDQIHEWYIKGISYDPEFNLKSDDRMYCSEMISKALGTTTESRIKIGLTHLTNQDAIIFSFYTHLSFSYASNLSVISIDNSYVNPFCHTIKQYAY